MRGMLVSLLVLSLAACSAAVPHAPVPIPHDAGPATDTNARFLYMPPRPSDAGPEPGQSYDANLPYDAGPPPTQCSAITGDGELATCPAGTVLGRGPAAPHACCPCTADDCTNPVCCATPVCAGSVYCTPFFCHELPASCGGMVNLDCDDFPEDCDEPCCPCTTC